MLRLFVCRLSPMQTLRARVESIKRLDVSGAVRLMEIRFKRHVEGRMYLFLARFCN